MEEVEIPRGGSGGIGAAGGCLLPLLLSLLLLLLLLVALCMSPWPRGREEVAGSGVRNSSSGRERWSFMPTSTWCCSDKSGEGSPASTTRVGSWSCGSSWRSVEMAAASCILSWRNQARERGVLG